jgi:GTP-binding protein
MEIKQAEFVKSSKTIDQCPPEDKPEFAFIGRSNVGKSSLINSLCNKKKLAKTSTTPGKTQLINHFLINETWFLVDLPGYGYAKTGRDNRKNWNRNSQHYFLERSNLVCVFVLVDARHEPLKNDFEFMEWLTLNGIPFAIVLTKADKLSKNKAQSQAARYRKVMKSHWESIPDFFLTSSETGFGKDNLLHYIDHLCQ